MELAEVIKKNLNEAIGPQEYLMPQFFDAPINIGNFFYESCKRGEIIKEFLSTVAKIAYEAILNQDEEIIRILFSEAPLGLSVEYHKNLPKCCWNNPVLFRTDESASGKIYEIQAPGSGWGDLFLYALSYKEIGINIPSELLSFPDVYAQNIIKATGKKSPKIFHMTDASSVPYSIRYLISVTNKLKYWGYSDKVNMRDIDCLISHSVISIPSSNYFSYYMEQARTQKLLFAIPPNLIFDEKAIYALPFYRRTQRYFSDSIRELFPYTSIIENDGFFDKSGTFVPIDEFVSLPSRKRKYYLKYGGPDTSRNWGSRSVQRLSGNDCRELLQKASKKAKDGEIWLIQEDESQSYDISSLTDDLYDLTVNRKLHVKLSCFYGQDNAPMGIKVMARKHFKVHGQKDTIVGLGVQG